MSGRSAIVRKEKKAAKDIGRPIHNEPSDFRESQNGSDGSASMGDFPMPWRIPMMQHAHTLPLRSHDLATIKSGSSEERHYAGVPQSIFPVVYETQIEKSSFRSLVDKKSDDVRKGLAKTFGGKKYKGEDRPNTQTSISANEYEVDGGHHANSPNDGHHSSYTTPRNISESEYVRPGPPQGKLPPIPQGLTMKKWTAGGRQPQAWNKLRKDPELWDQNGDVLVYFGRDDQHGPKPQPSFRVASWILERTGSPFFELLLQRGSLEREGNGFDMPPSPFGSPHTKPAYPVRQPRYQQTPPISENDSREYDGQISYEIFFEHLSSARSPMEIARYQVTIRNVFAILYDVSLAGYNFFHTLTDLQERLEEWMPAHTDSAGMIIEYLIGKSFDDFRDNPSMAACLLAWSESKSVRWDEGWTEAFIHCCGMQSRLETTPDSRYVSSIARALLERASLDMQVRVHDAETRLSDFNFGDMWPKMTDSNSPEKQAFEKIRDFFLSYYRTIEGRWPPLTPATEDSWLTRTWAQRLQTDFGTLYDYLVDRTVTWDGHEERSGRKWNIIRKGHSGFDVESLGLPFTDLIAAFDNSNKIPHIPHPYCLVPEPSDVHSKKSKKQAEDKMAVRKAALAYTNSTNVFILGADAKKNQMVEEFLKYEKDNYSPSIDPYAARRGRWVLIYAILQVLGSVSVDSPAMRYSDGVSYHLSPTLRRTPPWAKHRADPPEATHSQSYCFLAPETWKEDPPIRFLEEDSSRASRRLPFQINTTVPLILTSKDPSTASASEREGGSLLGGSYKKQAAFNSSYASKSPESPKRRVSHRSRDNAENRSSKQGYNSYHDRTAQNSNVANSNAPRMPSRNDSNMADMSFSPARTERDDYIDRTEYLNPAPATHRPTKHNPSPERRNFTAPAFAPTPVTYEQRLAQRKPQQEQDRMNELSNTGYGAGIEKVEGDEEWPIR